MAGCDRRETTRSAPPGRRRCWRSGASSRPAASRRTRCAPTAPTSRAGGVGTRRGREPGGARLSRPARLRRGALRAWAGARQRGPQARRGSQLSRLPGPCRWRRAESGRAAAERRSADRGFRACSGPRRSRRCWSGSRRGRRSRSVTGRCSSSPTRAGCGPRRSSTSTSDGVDFESETRARDGQGLEDPDGADR